MKLGAARGLDVDACAGARGSWHRGTGFLPFLLFFIYLFIGNFILGLPTVVARFIDPWAQITTAAAASLTRFLGFEARASGSNLSSRGTSLSVRKGCDGVHAMLLLASAIVASPAPRARKLLGLLMGAIVILGFNIIRVVNLLLVAVYFPARLEFFHVYVWQIVIGLLAFGTFLVWGTYLAGRR